MMAPAIAGFRSIGMSNHPITPPTELVQQWAREIYDKTSCGYERDEHIATRAAQWGADQELEACIDWISVYTGLEHPELLIELLRAARRPSPKPPSLKRVALLQLDTLNADLGLEGKGVDLSQIRRALEQLNG